MRLDQTLIQVRERAFLDIMDLALSVVRRRPVELGVTALAGILPWALLNQWLTADADGSWTVANLVLVALEAPLATAPLTVMMGGLMFGKRPKAREILVQCMRGLPRLLFFQFVLRGFMLATFILAIFIPIRLTFLNEVILLERGPWGRVFGRTGDLTNDRQGDLFAQWMAMLFFGAAFALAFWYAVGNLIALWNNELTWESLEWGQFLGLRALVGLWISVAFFSVVRFLTYIDQRIRLEGWEVQLRLRSVGTAMRQELEP